jgi:hypothetical protein
MYDFGYVKELRKLPDAKLVKTDGEYDPANPWGRDVWPWGDDDNYAVMTGDLKKVLSVGETQAEAIGRAIFLWYRP